MMKKFVTLVRFFFCGIYHARTYWFLRNIVVDNNDRTPNTLKKIMLLFLRRCDAKYCGSIATYVGGERLLQNRHILFMNYQAVI